LIYLYQPIPLFNFNNILNNIFQFIVH
jgi:hypothetical protein